MSSSGWAEAVLWVAVLAPIAALVPAFALASDPERWGRAGCGLAAAAWGVLLVGGAHPHVGRLAPDELALAGGIGAALLGARATGATAAPVAAVTAAMAVGRVGDPSIVAPLLGIAVAAVLVTIAGRTHPTATTAVALAVVVAAIGIHAGGSGGAALVVASSAVVVIAGGVAPRSPLVVVVPAALVEAMRVGPQLAGTPASRWLAVAIATAALVAVASSRLDPRVPVVPPVVGALAWVLVASIGPFPDATDAARILAAGAVLAVLLGGPLALAATLPGVVLLTDAIAGGSGVARLALGALAFGLLVTIGIARAPARPARSSRQWPADSGLSERTSGPVDAVALVLAGWLVVRPTAWTWLRVTGLRAYTEGVALAAAAGLLAGVGLFSAGATWQGTGPARLLLETTPEPPTAPAHVRRVTAAATVATGIVAALLVRSARL